MPESIANLRKEKSDLKSKVSTVTADCGFNKINQGKEYPLLYLRLGQIQILQKLNHLSYEIK